MNYLFPFVLLITAASFAQHNVRQDLQYEQLAGPVEKVRIRAYVPVKTGDTIGRGEVMRPFDQDHQPRDIVFDTDGNYRRIERYDEKEELLLTENYVNVRDSVRVDHIRHADGKKEIVSRDYLQRLPDGRRLWFNSYGIYNDGSLALMHGFRYFYDSTGLQTSFQYIQGPGMSNRKKTERPTKIHTTTVRIFYDSTGRESGWESYQGDTLLKARAERYRSIERIRTYKPDSTISGGKTLEFDAHGNVVRVSGLMPSGFSHTAQTLAYTYDSRGNWIMAIVYEKKDEPLYIVEREIVYRKERRKPRSDRRDNRLLAE